MLDPAPTDTQPPFPMCFLIRKVRPINQRPTVNEDFVLSKRKNSWGEDVDSAVLTEVDKM